MPVRTQDLNKILEKESPKELSELLLAPNDPYRVAVLDTLEASRLLIMRANFNF